MSDTTIPIDLDPKKVIQGLDDIIKSSQQLKEELDKTFKNAGDSLGGLEEQAKNSSAKMEGFFTNLSKRIRGDLKTAFNLASVTEGAKFVNDMAQGVKQVFEMERAFDRLNTRLGLSGVKLAEFKKGVGSAVASTGQKLEDVLPGVETMASKGGVKNPGQLTDIAKFLGESKAITGEDTGHLADTIVEILKNQGQAITNTTVKGAMDAIQGTRVNGAFKTAGEAGDAIKNITSQISPQQMKAMGLGTREIGGLAAMASQGGEQGENILSSILKDATSAEGKAKLNAIFGAGIFKGSKLDVGALGNVDQKRFGQYSEQIMGGAANVDQADLQRFLTAMKGGQEAFNNVIKGTNETASQYETATDNFASKISRFKETLKEATREIGGELSAAANEFAKGNMMGAAGHIMKSAGDAWENKGALAAGAASTIGVGLLMGGGMNALLKNVPGGGMLGGAAGGAAADAAGIQKVYVVNMGDMGGGGLGDKIKTGMSGLLGAAGANLSLLGSSLAMLGSSSVGALASAGAAGIGTIGAGVTAAGAAGYGAGQLINMGTGAIGDKFGIPSAGEKLYDLLNPDNLAKGVEQGMTAADRNKKVMFTNPSSVAPRH